MRKLYAWLIAAVSMAGWTPFAHGQMIGCGFTSGTVFNIDPTTGATSNVKTTGFSFIGIACSPNGTFYGIDTNTTALRTIDPATGATSLVGFTGLTRVVEGDLAFSPTGVLYAFDGWSNRVLTINTATGAATYLSPAPLAADDISALFFVGSALYGVDDRVNAGGNAQLFRFDPTTGTVISNVSLNIALTGSLAGAEADPITGTVYFAAGGHSTTGSLYTLDVATPALTLVGSSTGLADVSGLTFLVPEPGSLSLLSLGTIALLARKRKTSVPA